MTALKEGDDAYMIEVGVKDQEFFDPGLVNAKFLELMEQV
jgi:hypothetical protein